jgi:hypothetical protein
MPTKSVWARMFAAVPRGAAAEAAASAASGEPVPKTVGMLKELSSSMLAVDTPPTSHPARVNGTQGAGAFLPFGASISGVPSASTSVQ